MDVPLKHTYIYACGIRFLSLQEASRKGSSQMVQHLKENMICWWSNNEAHPSYNYNYMEERHLKHAVHARHDYKRASRCIGRSQAHMPTENKIVVCTHAPFLCCLVKHHRPLSHGRLIILSKLISKFLLVEKAVYFEKNFQKTTIG